MAESDESISISVTDRVSTTIATKFTTMAAGAREAFSAIERLQQALAALKSGDSVSKLASDMARLTTSVNSNSTAQNKLAAAADKSALAQQRIATEAQKTQVQIANVEAALQKAIAAENLASIAGSKLAAAQMTASTSAQKFATAQQQTAAAATQAQTAIVNLTAAQTNAAVAAQRLTTAQAQTAVAQANASAAAARSATATQGLAAATTKAQTAQTQGATAAQRLATEQQRTAVQTANAASAADRASLAALRLAEAQKRAAEQTKGSATAFSSWAKAAAAAVGVTLSAGGILNAADAYTVLQNKLQNVAESQAQVNELTERLFGLANETRTNVDATATSFARFDRALKGMGKSQEDTLRMTETVNKALVVGGATAQEAASALLQLSQAFNAGKLQGDEFRAVSENMPAVLDAVAKVLNKPISQVKQLGSEGKITAKVMYDAFKSIETSIDATFAKTTPTISQAMTVLNNNFQKFTGEVNKATGFTAALSRGIIELSAHMKELALVAAVVGAGLLVYFGPALLSGIQLATRAVWTFTAAIAANPIGLIVVAITAATAALMLYGDELTLSAKRQVTFKDGALTAWAYIKDGATAAATAISSAWNSAIDFVNSKTNGWGEKFRDIGAAITTLLKRNANSFIGTFVGAYDVIRLVWAKFPDLLKYFFEKAINFTSIAVSQIANLWIDGLLLINKGIAAIAPDAAAGIEKGLNAIRITLPQIDVGEEPKAAAAEVGRAFSDAFNKDYLGDAAKSFMDRAALMARNRRVAAGVRGRGTESNLRGAGADTTGTPLDKATENRATALAKVNLQLDNELDRMSLLQPAREAQAKFDQIEETMLGKKIKLTDTEVDSIKAKIKAIQDATVVQKAMDQIYEAAIAPQRDYNAQITAADKLLSSSAISQSEYDKAVTKATESYKNAVDPMRQFNKELEQRRQLLSFAPPDRTVEQQVQQQQNAMLAQGTVLTEAQTQAMRENIRATEDYANLTAASDSIFEATAGAMSTLVTQQAALSGAYAAGAISQQLYANQMAQTNVAIASLQNQMGNGSFFSVFTEGVGAALQGFTTLASGVADIIGNTMQTTIDGVSSSIGNAIARGDDLKASLQSVSQTIVAEMLGSLIKLGAQYAVNTALEMAGITATTTAKVASEGVKTTASLSTIGIVTGASLASTAVTTTAQVAAAGTTLAAWLPAALVASIGTFGAAAVVGGAALLSIMALTRGFQSGGYTGNSAVDQIAGVVHGQEYVVPAAATSRIGVQNLDRMVSGGDVASVNRSVQTSSTTTRAAGMPSVTVNNNGTPQEYQVESWSEDSIRLVAQDVAQKTVAQDAGKVVARDLRNPNSKASKSFANNTLTKRRR